MAKVTERLILVLKAMFWPLRVTGRLWLPRAGATCQQRAVLHFRAARITPAANSR